MIHNRALALLLSATLPLGSIGCGMFEVATGEAVATDAGAHAADADADADARSPSPADADADAGSDAATSIIIVGGDSGKLPTCQLSGAVCTGPADCCGGLACTDDEEQLRCK